MASRRLVFGYKSLERAVVIRKPPFPRHHGFERRCALTASVSIECRVRSRDSFVTFARKSRMC